MAPALPLVLVASSAIACSAFSAPKPALVVQSIKNAATSHVQLSHGGSGGGSIFGGGNGNWGRGGGGGDGDNYGDDMSPMLYAGVLGNLWADYNNVLAEKPILTKACTSLVGFSLGDILAQKAVQKKERLDLAQTARLAAFGFAIHGTLSHFFYNALDEQIPAKDAVGIITKVFIDQVLWAPIFTFIFLAWTGIGEGKNVEQLKVHIREKLVTGVTGSWRVWPIAHAINFKFIPTEQRLLYINTIQIFYNVFLSVLASGKRTV